MRDTDFDAFGELLDAVCSLLSRGTYTPSATNTALWFRALSAHDLASVRAGFDAHVRDPQRGRFIPTPADILAQLDAADDGRPGPEEAWAIALGAQDERTTVVWTQDIAAAWNVAKPVLAIGDEVGARMAFREAYMRIIGEARAEKQPAAWMASIGFDTAGREGPMRAAVAAGRLSSDALLALPAPASAAALELVGGIADKARQSLREVADELRRQQDEIIVDTQERDRLNARKAAIAQGVADYVRGSDTHDPQTTPGA
jgi:hypothetical protein